jgi:hypothetical protein
VSDDVVVVKQERALGAWCISLFVVAVVVFEPACDGKPQWALLTLVLLSPVLLTFLVWAMWGVEVVRVTGERLSIERRIGRVWAGREREFLTSDVRNMRVEPRIQVIKGVKGTSYVIVFDYRGRQEVLTWFSSSEHPLLVLQEPLLQRFLRV